MNPRTSTWGTVASVLVILATSTGCSNVDASAEQDSAPSETVTPTVETELAVKEDPPYVASTATPSPPEEPQESTTYQIVADKHNEYGLTITIDEWESISALVCQDTKAGLPGKYLSKDLIEAPDNVQHEITNFMWAAALFESCGDTSAAKELSTAEQDADVAFTRAMATSLGLQEPGQSAGSGSVEFRTVEALHAVHGMTITQFEWETISGLICDDASEGLPAKYLSPELGGKPELLKDRLTHFMWAGALYEFCPEAKDVRPLTWKERESETFFMQSLAITLGFDPPNDRLPRDYGAGDGNAVQCEDGSYSNAGGIQGACSHHGGLRDP